MKILDAFSKWIVASKIRTFIFMIVIGVIMTLFALLDVIRGQEPSGKNIMLQNLGIALTAYAGYKLTSIFLDFKHIFWGEKLKSFLRVSMYVVTAIVFAISSLCDGKIVCMVCSCIFCVALGIWFSVADGVTFSRKHDSV